MANISTWTTSAASNNSASPDGYVSVNDLANVFKSTFDASQKFITSCLSSSTLFIRELVFRFCCSLKGIQMQFSGSYPLNGFTRSFVKSIRLGMVAFPFITTWYSIMKHYTEKSQLSGASSCQI